MVDYKKLNDQNGVWDRILRLQDNTSFARPQPNATHNPPQEQYLADVASGNANLIEADARPTRYSEYEEISPRYLVTTNNTPTEIARYALRQNFLYVAHLDLEAGIPADAGYPIRHIEGTITAKRIANGAQLVGNPVIQVDQADVASPIPVSAAVSGNDLIIRVTGANKTIRWYLSGKVKVVALDGVS